MLNDEQILELLLEYLSGDSNRNEGFAGEALVYHVMINFPELQSGEEIAEKCNMMLVNHNIAKLHAKDLIDITEDENGEEVLTPTVRAIK